MSRVKTVVFLLLVATFAVKVQSQAPQPAAVTVFEGARLIVGDGSAPIENSAFVIQGNGFTQVGRKGQMKVPAGAVCVDLIGKIVMLTIIDAHTHQSQMR